MDKKELEDFKNYYCKRKCFFSNMTIIDERKIPIEQQTFLEYIDFPQKYCDACKISKFIEALKNEL